jgi:hypothetical protein
MATTGVVKRQGGEVEKRAIGDLTWDDLCDLLGTTEVPGSRDQNMRALVILSAGQYLQDYGEDWMRRHRHRLLNDLASC